MNVGHLISSLATGGAETMLLRYARHADRPLTVFSLGGGDLEPAFEATDATLVDLDVDSVLRPDDLGRVRAALAAADVDLLHAHLPSAMVVARLAGRAAGVDRIVSTHHNWTYPRGLGAIERATRPLDSREVAVSGAVRDNQSSRFDRTDWSTIPNGIPVESFNRDVAAAPPPDDLDGPGPVFLNVGRYVSQKRQADLIDAATLVSQELPEARVVIVGHGPREARLRSKVADEGLEDVVTVTGRVPDVEPFYAAADAFVFASQFEGLPVTGLEAMAAQLPIVGTRVPGITEIVEEGTTGQLVPPRDPAALASAMVAVGMGDTEAMGTRGYDRAREQYSIERMVIEHERLYDRCAPA